MTTPLQRARDAFAALHPEARIDLNGRDWGVIDMGGAGPALLLIPGTLGRADIFWQQMAALGDRMRIVAVSYPAAGGVAEWTDDMALLLDRLGIASAGVLGSSLGGYLAQYMAARHPERIAQLFAANTLHSVDGLAARPPYSNELDAGPIETLRAGFGDALRAWGAAHPEQGDLVALLLAESDGRILEPELRTRLKAIKHGPELPPLPEALRARCVTIEADDDPLVPASMRDAVRARLKPARSYRFQWGGHFPYVVRPDLYTAILAFETGLSGDLPGWAATDEGLTA